MDNATSKSCFGQWLSFLDEDRVHSVSRSFGADKYVKKLDTWTLLRIFLLGQLQQFRGLRDLEVAVQNNPTLQANWN